MNTVLLKKGLVNADPLSETRISGNPWVENMFLSAFVVAADVVEGTTTTSSHLVCASMTTRNIFPRKGPAWSTCTRVHGLPGHSHGCKGATEGAFLVR